MPVWHTQYAVGEDIYASSVWAPTMGAAVRVCKRRNIGETVMACLPSTSKLGHGRPSTALRRLVAARTRKRPATGDVVHGLTWLMHLWCSQHGNTRVNAAEATGDTGWFHEAIHLIAFGRMMYESCCGRPWMSVIDRVRAVEADVPGYLPSASDRERFSARALALWE